MHGIEAMMTFYIHDYKPPRGFNTEHKKLVLSDRPETASYQSCYGPFDSRDEAIGKVRELFGDRGFHERGTREFHAGPHLLMSHAETVEDLRFYAPTTLLLARLHNIDFAGYIDDYVVTAKNEGGRVLDDGAVQRVKAVTMAFQNALVDRDVAVTHESPEVEKAILDLACTNGADRDIIRGKRQWNRLSMGNAMQVIQNKAMASGFVVLQSGLHVLFAKGAL